MSRCTQAAAIYSLADSDHAVRVTPSHYRGRIAPSPTGHLHLGHARTFWIAHERARRRAGTLVLRIDDLDGGRCRPEFISTMLEDLRWLGLEWDEGSEQGGRFGPYRQSQRMEHYRAALAALRAGHFVYPCLCSRKDVRGAASAPHAPDDEPLYPGHCRGRLPSAASGVKCSWRFRVPDGEDVSFIDGHFGPQRFIAGKDFGDFVVWRPDDVPAYQLACVIDDAAMQISEVVRGADLLVSTARQLLLYRALGLAAPGFYHCDLVLDQNGSRLAKRHDALSLRTLRVRGKSPQELREGWRAGPQSAWNSSHSGTLRRHQAGLGAI